MLSSKENHKVLKINSLEELNEFISERNYISENIFYVSDVPDVCRNSPCMLGIDEAGRGPVLGPMVYGIAVCPMDEVSVLESLQCADSKSLNEEVRDRIFGNMCAHQKLAWGVEIISPNSICSGMLQRSKHSLNEISMDSAIGLIKAVAALGVNISHVYVDTVGPPEKYQAHLCKLFPNYDITVAKKADSKYPVVSAASIFAKVTRDHALQVWECDELTGVSQKDFGSGYPSDPVTKQFLKTYCDPVFGFPQIVRFSWSTAANVLEENAYHVECEEVDENKGEAVASTTVKISSYFKKSKPEKVKHEFFRNRYLETCTDL